ncbi:MAG: radical SAM protein [Enterococcus aquimarinus]
MNYNISKYIIAQPINNEEILLYSTLSTSILTLEKQMYSDIFIDKKFEPYVKECEDLERMGFLFLGDDDTQAEALEKIRKDIVEAEHGITAVTIAPTMECNARCYYCFEKGARRGTMSEMTADKVASFLIEHCTEKKIYIAWFGGEPLMAPDIISQISNRLSESGIEIESTVTTNGILLDENMVKNLKVWNTTRVQITVDGIDDEYNKVKRYTIQCHNPFETIMKNIELTIRSGISVHLRVNYKSTDPFKVKETMSYLHNRFGQNENLYLYGVPLDLPEIKGYSEFDEKEGEIFLNVLDYSLKRGYENDELNFAALRVSEDYNKALGELMLSPFPAPCFMVNKDRYVIDDAGNLYKCQKHLGKEQFRCGTVFDNVDKNEIFNYYSTQKVHDDNCVDCKMFPICQGGCNANRLLYGSKFACPPSKSIVEKLVLKYYQYLLNGTSY